MLGNGIEEMICSWAKHCEPFVLIRLFSHLLRLFTTTQSHFGVLEPHNTHTHTHTHTHSQQNKLVWLCHRCVHNQQQLISAWSFTSSCGARRKCLPSLLNRCCSACHSELARLSVTQSVSHSLITASLIQCQSLINFSTLPSLSITLPSPNKVALTHAAFLQSAWLWHHLWSNNHCPVHCQRALVPQSDPCMNCKVSPDHFKMLQLHISHRSSPVTGGTAARHTVKSAQMCLFSFLVCSISILPLRSAPRYLSEQECVVSKSLSTCREYKQLNKWVDDR